MAPPTSGSRGGGDSSSSGAGAPSGGASSSAASPSDGLLPRMRDLNAAKAAYSARDTDLSRAAHQDKKAQGGQSEEVRGCREPSERGWARAAGAAAAAGAGGDAGAAAHAARAL